MTSDHETLDEMLQRAAVAQQRAVDQMPRPTPRVTSRRSSRASGARVVLVSATALMLIAGVAGLYAIAKRPDRPAVQPGSPAPTVVAPATPVPSAAATAVESIPSTTER